MGFVKVKGLIGSSRESTREVEFLADSGTFYTVLPPNLAGNLGIIPTVSTLATLADKRQVEMGVTVAYLQLLDREGAVPVGVMDVPMPLLGVTALECLGLKVDPTTGVLEHSRPFGPAIL